jgi:hypothetical protein
MFLQNPGATRREVTNACLFFETCLFFENRIGMNARRDWLSPPANAGEGMTDCVGRLQAATN